LKRRKSNIVGILFPTSIGLLFTETLVAIQEKIQERQMPLIIGNSKYNMEEENRLVK